MAVKLMTIETTVTANIGKRVVSRSGERGFLVQRAKQVILDALRSEFGENTEVRFNNTWNTVTEAAKES